MKSDREFYKVNWHWLNSDNLEEIKTFKDYSKYSKDSDWLEIDREIESSFYSVEFLN